MAEHASNPLDPVHLIEHVKDADYFQVPRALGGQVHVPQFRDWHDVLWQPRTGVALVDQLLEPLDGHLTKFMVLEVLAACLVAVTFVCLANRMSGGGMPRGRWWNFLETMLVFIRDQVARPAIGKHDADRFLPLLWSLFFFILVCNLLGMIPWLGSPTGALATTGALAMVTFLTVIGTGMVKMGVIGYWRSQVPHMELPLVLAVLLKPMVFAIEILGLVIKHFVLSVRLLANMMAGHLVLGVLVAFVAAVGGAALPLFMGVSVASVVGAVALSMLELFVAFLQAYIFTFLSALFIGMAVHPH